MSSNRPVIALILLFAVALIGYFGFSSIMDAALIEGVSVFLAPVAWFFFILTLFSVGALVWHERVYQTSASILLVMPSFFFAPTIAHAGVSIVAGLCVFAGLLHMRRELMVRIRLSLYRSVAVGVAPIIFALSLVISSQYYTHISVLSWDRLVPNFDLAEGSGAWLLRLAGTLSPSLSALQDRNLSVDEFLFDLKPVVEVGGPEETIGNGIDEAVRQAGIIRSKLELSRLLGRRVNGDESMNALLSEALRKKTVAFVSGDAVGETKAVPFLPFFLALLLFFTIYPLGSLLVPLVLSIATVIFSTLVRSGLIVVKKVPAEQEVIV